MPTLRVKNTPCSWNTTSAYMNIILSLQNDMNSNHSLKWLTMLVLIPMDRYVIDNDSEMKMFLEEHVPTTTGSQDLDISGMELSWLPKVIKDFVLPSGFPGNKHHIICLHFLLLFLISLLTIFLVFMFLHAKCLFFWWLWCPGYLSRTSTNFMGYLPPPTNNRY